MNIGLTTLGGLQVDCDGRELDWLVGQRGRAALFVHLAVERRASRAALTALFWPESDEARARQSLRQALYNLKKGIGCEWLDARVHEVRVHDHVQSDAGAFAAAIERDDAETAVSLYTGPFLAGINLLDLKPWESWVDGRRALYARAFRRACRTCVDAAVAAGDVARAVDVARRWVTPDPLDDEAQHRLIELLVGAGERAGAIRQYEAYLRLLDADGLRPLDETVALMEQIRVAVPAAPSASPALPQAPPAPRPLPVPVDSASAEATPGITASLPASPPGNAMDRPAPARLTNRAPAALGFILAASVVLLAGAAWLARPHGVAGEDDVVAQPASDAPGIVLADFPGPDSDPDLGAVVTNALRIDLQRSPVVHVLDAAQVDDVLRRMRTEDDIALGPELAREVALRHGAEGVLQGNVVRVGSGWVLTASLHAAASGEVLASYRETAGSPDDLIPAIDRLSQAIRAGARQSLQGIAAPEGFAQVTTSSLAALHFYADAERSVGRRDFRRAAELLEEALALDPDFAMAWRLLASSLSNSQVDPARQTHAARRAFELRDRLPPRERHLAAASYHQQVTRDWPAAVDHYRKVLEIQPHDETALNNLALLLRRAGDFEAAAELLEQATTVRPNAVQSLNLVATRLAQGRVADAAAVADGLEALGIDPVSTAEAQFAVRQRLDDLPGARAAVVPLLDAVRPPRERAWAHDRLGRLALLNGMIGEARSHFEAAERIVRDAGVGFNALGWRVSRAHAEALLGDPAESVRLLTGRDAEALAVRAPAGSLDYYRAVMLGLAGRPRDAMRALQRLEAELAPELREPMRAQTATARAVITLHQGDAEAAVRAIEEARAGEACRYCAAAVMGHALLEAGRLPEAIMEWEHVLAGRDMSEDLGFVLVLQLWVLQRLPGLYEDLGDTATALQHHRRLVSLWRDADPELQVAVERSRERIRSLQPPRRLSAAR